jgi:hypothetical protein
MANQTSAAAMNGPTAPYANAHCQPNSAPIWPQTSIEIDEPTPKLAV